MAVKEEKRSRPQEPSGSRNGGMVFIRWEQTTCPTTNDTKLFYKGKASRSHFTQTGGGANYICQPIKAAKCTHVKYIMELVTRDYYGTW